MKMIIINSLFGEIKNWQTKKKRVKKDLRWVVKEVPLPLSKFKIQTIMQH